MTSRVPEHVGTLYGHAQRAELLANDAQLVRAQAVAEHIRARRIARIMIVLCVLNILGILATAYHLIR